MYQKRNKELEIISLYRDDYKKSLYLREISKITKIPLKTVQTLLNDLEKDNILKSTIKGKNKYFKINLENVQTKLLLLQSEIYKTRLFLEKYPQFKIFVKNISSNEPVIVFGSFAKFLAEKDSDIDLLILSSKKESKLPLYLIPNKIHQIRLSENTFIKSLKKQETLIKEVESNHIILNNHSFYVNLMWSYYEK